MQSAPVQLSAERTRSCSGLIVALASVLGAGYLLGPQDAAEGPVVSAAIVRAAAPATPALSSSARALPLAAAMLVLFLWIGRQTALRDLFTRQAPLPLRVRQAHHLGKLRRKASISYRIGSLYGP